MAGNKPLFAPERRSSATSEERAAREDDALLGNRRCDPEEDEYPPKVHKRAGFWREIGLFVWAALATAAVIVLAVVLQHQGKSHPHGRGSRKPTAKRNLIFMVSDGSSYALFKFCLWVDGEG
jgi:alkaline phosphatase